MPKHTKPPIHPQPTIHYYTYQQFGRQDRYIVSAQLAQAFKALTGRVILLDKDIASLGAMGFRFEEVPEPRKP